jgi:hypothetical protein
MIHTNFHLRKNSPIFLNLLIVGILSLLLEACSTHRIQNYQIPPGSISPDTLRITHYQARKSQKKVLVIFQTPITETDKAFFKTFDPWKKRGYDLLILDYPHPENAILRKALSGVSVRSNDYQHALRRFIEDEYRFVYYGMSHAGIYALSLSENIRPDYVVLFQSAPVIAPLKNFDLLFNHDTLSTDKTWQPVDDSKDAQETFIRLQEAVEKQNFTGLMEFDGFNENFWAEANSFDFNTKLFNNPSYFILRENEPSVSKTAMTLFTQLFNKKYFTYEPEEEELQEVHERVIREIDQEKSELKKRFFFFF